MKTGVELITEERARQVDVEKWTIAHDATHLQHQLAFAAVAYALPAGYRGKKYENGKTNIPRDWPWERCWWKPDPCNRVHELTKAGALIAAEIDRLQKQLI